MARKETTNQQVLDIINRLAVYARADPRRKLVASIVIDALGNCSMAVPILGEIADVFWAPVSAAAIAALYDDTMPAAKYIGFFEELLPFTDIIPTATIAWLKENYFD